MILLYKVKKTYIELFDKCKYVDMLNTQVNNSTVIVIDNQNIVLLVGKENISIENTTSSEFFLF